MNIGKALSKIFYKETSKAVRSSLRQRAIKREAEEYGKEKRRQNDAIHDKRLEYFKNKIDVINQFLIEEIDLMNWFQKKEKEIDDWFYVNHWLKTVDERKIPANYGEMKITNSQRDKMFNLIQLKEGEYVPRFGGMKDEHSTLEFIIENTTVFKELKSKQLLKGYDLYAATRYVHGISGSTTICFGLLVSDNAKPPF